MPEMSLARIESSNLPASQKSALRKWYDSSMSRYGGTLSKAKAHAVETGHVARQGGESFLTGAALGAAHCYMKTGLDVGKVPIDGAIGVLGLLACIAMPTETVTPDIRNVAASALTVFSFRQSYKLCAKKRKERGENPGGTFAGEDEFGEEDNAVDPIIAAARRL